MQAERAFVQVSFYTENSFTSLHGHRLGSLQPPTGPRRTAKSCVLNWMGNAACLMRSLQQLVS